MDINDRVRDLANRVSQQLPHVQTEEATKLALINPFIREVLGYNTADLSEVVPEYVADIGSKKGEKVDYAILREGIPLILIEAKKAGTRLQEEEPHQLYRYFTATTSAKFGVYTDGVRYLFYSDLDKPNVMDHLPFLILDLMEADPGTLDEVAKFVKPEFDPDAIRASANSLKYTRALKAALDAEMHDPSEEFVRHFMDLIYRDAEGRPYVKTRNRLVGFTAMLRAAGSELIRDQLRGTLNSALARGESHEAAEADEAEAGAVEEPDDGIVTTEEEIGGFYAVKAILNGVVGPKRVFLRDYKSYCSILLDDTNRKPLCRFRFDDRPKRLSLFDVAADRRETHVTLDGVDDLYEHAEALRATARWYEARAEGPE